MLGLVDPPAVAQRHHVPPRHRLRGVLQQPRLEGFVGEVERHRGAQSAVGGNDLTAEGLGLGGEGQ